MTIQGADDLQKKLARLSSQVVGSALATSVKAGALKIENAARQKVRVRTGTLKRSIHSEIIKQTDTMIEIAIGPNTPYARRIEFGYDGETDKQGRTYHQRAYPYMRPAFDEQKDAAQDTIKVSFKALINKAAQ